MADLAFPAVRLRRTRRYDWSRRLVRENQLSVNDLIWPLFVTAGEQVSEPISSMPGVSRYNLIGLVAAAKQAEVLGIPAIALFPHVDPSLKTPRGDEALNPDNLICRAIQAVKANTRNLGVIADVALDPYTDHGHDGVVVQGDVANDETVAILVEQALLQARAGCDVLAPSDMQDGRIGAIRQALEQAGLSHCLILSYAAKYASCFYGPFRDAVGSSSQLAGQSKATYQQDPANSQEALREVLLDQAEGADMLMVKPGMPYLDVIYRVKQCCQMPTFAYQVSGEYQMLVQYAQQSGVPFESVFLESLCAFKRAGCDGILTYAAKEVAEVLRGVCE